jgi:hypothetical protein
MILWDKVIGFQFANCPGGEKQHTLRILADIFDSWLSQILDSMFFS